MIEIAGPNAIETVETIEDATATAIETVGETEDHKTFVQHVRLGTGMIIMDRETMDEFLLELPHQGEHRETIVVDHVLFEMYGMPLTGESNNQPLHAHVVDTGANTTDTSENKFVVPQVAIKHDGTCIFFQNVHPHVHTQPSGSWTRHWLDLWQPSGMRVGS